MEINQATGSYQQMKHQTGDAVFASNQLYDVWPAKITRINKNNTYRVQFFLIKEQETVTTS